MNLLDIFEQREPHEKAIDALEQRRIEQLEQYIADLKKAQAQVKSAEQRQAIQDRISHYEKERVDLTLGRHTIHETEPPRTVVKRYDAFGPKDNPNPAAVKAAPAKPAPNGGIRGNLPAKQVPGKSDLLKGRGSKYFGTGKPVDEDQSPVREAKKKSSEVDDVQNLAVQRYLTRARRENPAAYSDLEAIAKHEMDQDQKTQTQLKNLEKSDAGLLTQIQQDNKLDQAQSQVLQQLQQQVGQMGQVAPAEPTPPVPPASTAVPAPLPAPTEPAVAAPPAGATPAEIPAPEIPASEVPAAVPDLSQLSKKDKKILPRVRKLQRSLEKRIDKYQTMQGLKGTEKMADMERAIADLQGKLNRETNKMSDQGQAATQQSGAQVLYPDFGTKLSAAGLEDEPSRATGTYGLREQQSPVIGSMVNQLSRGQDLYDSNATAFKDAYKKNHEVDLYYGGSAHITLPFSDMDALVSTITAFPPSQKPQIWKKLFTDPNYLNQFMDQYVEQRGLIEADVIPLAQQRQAPDQLKAYNRALEIMRAARDTSVPAERVNQMKQLLFKDFGTRIQRHPQGYYYMVFDGKPIKLPNPQTFPVEEGWSDQGNPTPYAVYIDGRQWKEFRNDEEARRVADKLRANLKLQGRDQKVTIAPSQAWLSGSHARLKESTAVRLEAEQAILKRIFVRHRDLMMEYGPEKITQATEEVVYNLGDQPVSDQLVSEWIEQVKQILGVVNETKTRLDPKCWKGKKIGNPKTKIKGGVRVNNCVPAESVDEGLKDPKDNPCWKGYHPVGTKKKAGRTVPNCVPNTKK